MLPFRTILVAADFSGSSRDAFRLACSLAREFKTRVVVLHVVEPMLVDTELGMPFPMAGGERAYHESLMEDLRVSYAPDRLVEVEYSTRDGLAAEEILRMTEEAGSDLVVMGTHGRTGSTGCSPGAWPRRSSGRRAVRCSSCDLTATPRDRSRRTLRGRPRPIPTVAGPPIRTILHPTDFSGSSAQRSRWPAPWPANTMRG